MTKKIKLIFFHPYSNLGGADRSLIRLINGLNTNQYEIVFISLNKHKNRKYFTKKIKFYVLKSKRTLFSISELKKIIYLENINFHKTIFISNQNFANVISCIALKHFNNIRLVLIERNHPDELKNNKNFLKYIKNRFILFMMRNHYKFSDRIIGISKGLSTDLSKLVNQKVTTIYNAASDDKLINKIKDKPINLKQFKNKKIILNVGFLEKQKDHITLLKAFHQVNRKIKNIHLIIIGKGSEFKNIQSYINEKKLNLNVSIFRNVLNATRFYKLADLFVLTSIYEGFANVIVEALENKCPVIASNCKSGPSEILENKKYGNIFPVKNYNLLSKLIFQHFKNTSELKNKALKFKKVKKYKLNKYINDYDNLFKKI